MKYGFWDSKRLPGSTTHVCPGNGIGIGATSLSLNNNLFLDNLQNWFPVQQPLWGVLWAKSQEVFMHKKGPKRWDLARTEETTSREERGQ